LTIRPFGLGTTAGMPWENPFLKVMMASALREKLISSFIAASKMLIAAVEKELSPEVLPECLEGTSSC